MGQFHFITAGESHGKGLVAVIEGMVAGLPLTEECIARDLKRRQAGYGRSSRMNIEQDKAEIISGVRHGFTIGSPISLLVMNRVWKDWQEIMSVAPVDKEVEPITSPRPGHADLAGVVKYGSGDIRPILERASARETAARVAVGAIARRFLEEFGIAVRSHTVNIGNCWAKQDASVDWRQVEKSSVHCADAEAEKAMIAAIDEAKAEGDTLGGVFEVVATGVPVGLGSHVQWHRRLDGRIAQAVMSINAVKGVEIGAGFALGNMKGSEAHDIVEPNSKGIPFPWRRATNRAGGIEGGMSNGEPIVVRAAVKPIATLGKPLPSVDFRNGRTTEAHYERSDICVVSAAGVIGEAMLAIVLTDAMLEKFGGDYLEETLANYYSYTALFLPETVMRRQKVNNNIALVGFSATGKSIVARMVAERLDWAFVDTDNEIVKLSGKTIPEIFEHDGEDRFRQLERETLEQVCGKEKVVIATGGGIILTPKNRTLLHETSVVACLEAKAETILQRLCQDALYSSNPVVRPLLAGDNPLERIRELKDSRQPYYAIADWTVHTDNLTLEQVSQEVIRGWHYANRYREHEEQCVGADLACDVATASGYYPVYVGWGLLDKLGEKMRHAGLSGVVNLISDETVFSVHGSRVRKILEKDGFAVNCCVVPQGEATKSIDHAVKLYDFLVEHHVERNDVVVALGGGMVGDLAGFVAATFLRGLPWLQVPTSLVGMADASIGGKVAVDHPQGKNLIGAFYQPCLVLADVQTLTTLPKRELTSGWAEVVKHGLILDAEFFQLLEANAEDLIVLVSEVTTKVIARSACIKARVVAEDEKETGKRIILNYGHTIAHGIEAASRYGRFLHGEAVAIGMMGAAKLSNRLGLLSKDAVERQKTLLQKFHLPTDCVGIDLKDVLAAMELDKKVRGKEIQWVLLEDIGKVVIRSDVPQKEALSVLEQVIKP